MLDGRSAGGDCRPKATCCWNTIVVSIACLVCVCVCESADKTVSCSPLIITPRLSVENDWSQSRSVDVFIFSLRNFWHALLWLYAPLPKESKIKELGGVLKVPFWSVLIIKEVSHTGIAFIWGNRSKCAFYKNRSSMKLSKHKHCHYLSFYFKWRYR